MHFTHHHQPLRCEYSATATQFSRVTHRILALCMHAVCIGFLHFYHPRTLPRGLTGLLFLLLSPLPCLSLAPGDDTLLEFTSCCCQEGKRERVAMLYRSLFARHRLTRTIWCLLFLHSFLYPSCSLLLFLHPPNPALAPRYMLSSYLGYGYLTSFVWKALRARGFRGLWGGIRGCK